MRKNFLSLFFLLSCLCLLGQQTPPPRIGLALSGGGAKGFAHIGVLKVLEEAGIRPDYITGTSMGSIIGGLYAIGYSAEELHQLVATQDWDLVISDRIPLSEVIYEEKPFFKNEFLELGIQQGKIKAPSGAIHGQQIEQLLSALSLRVYDKRSFDDFPIPYRCVGVDVIKGEVVEFEEGYLPDIMRISMAIPSVFTAIRQDSMVLIDGGLIRNFPVQEVAQMGADIIIGVYVGAEQNTYENTQSFSDILYQTGFLYSIKDHYDQLPLVDYYVEPNLADYSAADFKQYDSLIYQGEVAARAILPDLKALADSLNNFPLKQEKIFPPIPDSLYIHTVQIEGNKNVSTQEILAHTNPLIGAYAKPEDLQNAVSSLYGTDLFDKVTYELLRDGELNVLKIRCNEKELSLLSTSLLYDSYNNAGFLFGITTRNTLIPASRLMFIGEISDNYSARVSLLKYLGKSRSSSFFAQFGIFKNEIPIYDNGSITSQYRIIEWPLSIQWQKRLRKNSQFSLGLRNNILNSSPIAGEDTRIFEDARYRSTSTFIGFNHNSLDRNVFPSRGAKMDIEAAFIFDDHFRFDSIGAPGIAPPTGQRTGTYQKYTFQLKSFIPLNSKGSLKLNPFAGIVVNARNNFADFYLLGGPSKTTQRSLPLLGLDPNELPVETAAGLSLGYQHFLNSNWLLSIDANAAYIATPSTLTATSSQSAFLAGMGASIGYRTIVGPIRFTVMYPLDTDQLVRRRLRTFLTFGYRF